MKKRILATIFLQPTSEQFATMQATQKAYQDAWFHVSRYAFEQRVCDTKVLHAETYADLRQKFDLPAAWARRIIREVGRLYQNLWKKVEDTSTIQRDGRATKIYTSLAQAPLSVNAMLSFRYGRGYVFTQQGHVSIKLIHGRAHMPCVCDRQHLVFIQQGATIGEANLWYDKYHESFSLQVTLEIEVANTPDTV